MAEPLTVIESAESIIRNLSPTEYSSHLVSLILQTPTLLGRAILTVVLLMLGVVFSLFYVLNLFGLKKWLIEKIRSESVTLVVGVVGFFIAFLLYEIWAPYLKTVDTLLIKKILIIAFYLFCLRAMTRFIKLGVEQFVKKRQQESREFFRRDSQRQISLAAITSYVLNGIVLFLFTLIVFDNLGINLRALLATAGVASIAVGFGAQSLIKDFIHGFYILWEDQFAVGDVIQINHATSGEVVRMTLRITQLRNPEGVLITVPNGSIETVENMSNEWSRIDWRLGVAYDSNIRHVFKVIEEVLAELKKDFPRVVLAEKELMALEEFGDSALIIRVWIRTRAKEQWNIKREFNLRIKERFDQEKINIPFPQRTVWMKKES